MPRVRKGSATVKARKRILRAARGYWGTKHRHKQQAKVALLRAGQYAYRDRRTKKRVFRRLWITRLNAACRQRGVRYSEFIHQLQSADIELDRKTLSELAISDPRVFDEIVTAAASAA